MSVTLEQVIADIESGKSTRIYTSSNTLWWTHLGNDVEEATIVGSKLVEEKHQRIMNDPAVPQDQKRKMNSLFRRLNNSDITIPKDPSGSPLYQMDEPKKWIALAQSKPDHYGKHQFDALMKTHHQNCEGECQVSWTEVNDLIDQNNESLEN